MPRIVNNPTQAICPSFESPLWDFVRQAIINTRKGLTAEEATQIIKDAWTRGNNDEISAWNAQLEQDRAEKAEKERLALELEEARRAQREREAEEQQREAEKKKPKFNSFDPNLSIGSFIVPRPEEYALNKIDKLEYVELDYFTVDPGLLSTGERSRNIRNDEDLSWGDITYARYRMLDFMARSKVWPTAHIESLSSFFIALERHPAKYHKNGMEALALYQSRVRREWFESNKGFKIEIIREDFLRSCVDLISDQVREMELEEVRAVATLHRELSLIFYPPPLPSPPSLSHFPSIPAAIPIRHPRCTLIASTVAVTAARCSLPAMRDPQLAACSAVPHGQSLHLFPPLCPCYYVALPLTDRTITRTTPAPGAHRTYESNQASQNSLRRRL